MQPSFARGNRSTSKESAVTLIKMIIIAVALILSILFFGRFLF
jgi:hypothetical protein